MTAPGLMGTLRRVGLALVRRLLSRGFAVSIMAVMALLLLHSALVGDSAVVRSPFFLALPCYLFLGIAASVALRLRQHLRASRNGPATLGRFRETRCFTTTRRGQDLESHLAAILGSRYETRRHGSRIEGRRGRFGFWGSVMFHLGLLLLLAGVVLSALTRATAELLLAEGFTIPLSSGPPWVIPQSGRLPELPGLSFGIRDFMAEYSAIGSPVDFSVLLSAFRNGRRIVEEQVRVNQAFRFEGLQITLHRYGFAPAIVAVDPAGRTALDGVVALRLLPPGTEDPASLVGGGRLVLALYPDHVSKDGRPATRSLAPARPLLTFRWEDNDGRAVASGAVAKGGSTTVDGYRVSFPDLSYWAGFIAARDLGLWLFVAASLIGSAGIALRMSCPDQAVIVTWEEGPDGAIVDLAAGTRFFPALHRQQVDRLVQEMAG